MADETDNTAAADVRFIQSGDNRCAFVHTPGLSPGVFFLGGFNSSMQGLKAMALEKHCRDNGIAFTRFDYSGHGRSSGAFVDGCISKWLADALVVFDAISHSPQIIVGSSMGAWIGTHLCLQRPSKVLALLGIASALDFTRDLLDVHLNVAQREEIDSVGVTSVASCYDDEAPYPITRRLIEDGEQHCLLDNEIALDLPVHLLHGTSDRDISWQTSVRFACALRSRQTKLTLIKGGDHRLSADTHLTTIVDALDEMLTDRTIVRKC